MKPEAPSPSNPPMRSCDQAIGAIGRSRTARASSSALNGLPAQASHDSRGNASSASGKASSRRSNRLAASRASSSRSQRPMADGNARSWLPASMSFCRRVQSPSVSGSSAMRLSLRMSQRRLAGSAPGGTWAIALLLKPTMSSCAQRPTASGARSPLPRHAQQRCQRIPRYLLRLPLHSSMRIAGMLCPAQPLQ